MELSLEASVSYITLILQFCLTSLPPSPSLFKTFVVISVIERLQSDPFFVHSETSHNSWTSLVFHSKRQIISM